MADLVLAPIRPAFRAIARTVVPETASLGEQAWAGVEAIIEHALAQRPARMRRQLALLVRAIDLLPLLTTGRRFRALGPEARERFLGRLQSAPLLLLRRGVWGIRTLVFMGYYARPEGAAAIGYRAHPRGWQARG